MRLYRAVFPECAEQNHDLYFRAIGPATVCDDSLAMQTGTTVRFDTYFDNLLHLPIYEKPAERRAFLILEQKGGQIQWIRTTPFTPMMKPHL